MAFERREASRSTLVRSYVSCGTVFPFSILPLSQKTHHITEAGENVSHLLNTAAGRGSDLCFTCHTAQEPHHSPALWTAGLFLRYRRQAWASHKAQSKGASTVGFHLPAYLAKLSLRVLFVQFSDLQESNSDSCYFEIM